MPDSPRFKRVLLKLSGETLGGSGRRGLQTSELARVAGRVKEIIELGVQVALVSGGGNLFRGAPAAREGTITRLTGDAIGMLATLMNGLALRDALEAAGVACELQCAFGIPGVVAAFDARRARHRLDDGQAVVLAGGTGHPFFTTDTSAALRACQIGADAVLKATQVDGVYSADPKTDPGARRYERLSYDQALNERLRVMDATAFSLCRDNGLPIIVFNFAENNGLRRVISGDFANATLVGELPPPRSAA